MMNDSMTIGNLEAVFSVLLDENVGACDLVFRLSAQTASDPGMPAESASLCRYLVTSPNYTLKAGFSDEARQT
jgi:hypothetical protein